MYYIQEVTKQVPPEQIGYVPYSPNQSFYTSIVQSFLIIFLSEIADKTFILVLIYSLKMHWIPLILTSLLSMYFMNILAIIAGYTFILFIPRNLINWLGFLCFLGFGIFSIVEGLEMDNKTVKEEYEEEVQKEENNEIVVDEGGQRKEKKSTLGLCMELFILLCLSELGDRSEISTVTITAVYNILGVLIGTMIAYFLAIVIAAFLGNLIGKFLTEKMMTLIGGMVFIFFAIQILVIQLFY